MIAPGSWCKILQAWAVGPTPAYHTSQKGGVFDGVFVLSGQGLGQAGTAFAWLERQSAQMGQANGTGSVKNAANLQKASTREAHMGVGRRTSDAWGVSWI